MSSPEETKTFFSAAHFIYIPLCVFVGVIIGWVLGSRSAAVEVSRLRQLAEEEEQKAARDRLSKIEKRS